MKTLKDLFLNQLSDMYDAERRIVKALPKLAKAATCDDLKAAFLSHLEETKGHVKKLEQVFQSLEEKARGKTCQATVGLLEEGGEIAAGFKGSPALNAALISAAQKVEHHEMAAYGCLHEWAGLLGNPKAAGLLQAILAEEIAANESLTALARDGTNQAALADSGQSKPQKDSAGRKPAGLGRGIRPLKTGRNRIRSLLH